MNDLECVHFLQTALPVLQMRWQGVRRVRKQICRRINERLHELKLTAADDYLEYLALHPDEWRKLKTLCRVTITRFYRDKLMFMVLEKEILPELAQQQISTGDRQLNLVSIGCASGEEPYTVAIIARLCLAQNFPDLKINITALDIDPVLLKRATAACYPFSSVRNLPLSWRESCFDINNDEYCLKAPYKNDVTFFAADALMDEIPGNNQVVFCRNLVFTYFMEKLQQQFLLKLANSMSAAGILVVGVHETLPDNSLFAARDARLGIYQKI